MKKNIDIYLTNIKDKISFSDINDFERFEERFFEIEKFFGDIIGMGLRFVEFCPNYNPPKLQEELLPWLWLIHPELKEEISIIADKKLKKIIYEY
jgi:hypothetical protein